MPEDHPRIRVAKMFGISNDLYGNNIASAHELAKGYTRPVVHDAPSEVSSDIRFAQQELPARRKLNLILKSKSIHEKPIHVGDQVQTNSKLSSSETWYLE